LDITEFQGTWYVFSPSAAGNLGLTIAPLGPDDYDWAIWGPYPPGTNPGAICPPVGPPIRCAASSGPATFASTGSYATGMGNATFSPPQWASTASSYGLPSTLDACPLVAPQRCGWVPGMQVTVGQVFLMYISNWSQSSTGFNLTWNLQNGASLDCTVLPVELIAFQAFPAGQVVDLQWTTASERNSDRFEVERSVDGTVFIAIGQVPAAGSAVQAQHYVFTDVSPHVGINFYRLRMVDTDGGHALSPVRSASIAHTGMDVRIMPNPGSGQVDVLFGMLEAGSQFVMLDATGREVLHLGLRDVRTTIDVSRLPSGLYGYRVLSASGGSAANGTWLRE
jgi:hypothetical protein